MRRRQGELWRVAGSRERGALPMAVDSQAAEDLLVGFATKSTARLGQGRAMALLQLASRVIALSPASPVHPSYSCLALSITATATGAGPSCPCREEVVSFTPGMSSYNLLGKSAPKIRTDAPQAAEAPGAGTAAVAYPGCPWKPEKPAASEGQALVNMPQ